MRFRAGGRGLADARSTEEKGREARQRCFSVPFSPEAYLLPRDRETCWKKIRGRVESGLLRLKERRLEVRGSGGRVSLHMI